MKPIVVEAVFEDGVLKPDDPLPLNEHDRVRITVYPGTSLAQRTHGSIGWAGPAEAVEAIALDPGLDPGESA
jgi:predicted DNA-binding antitoxin AbrB/MazE fold protein